MKISSLTVFHRDHFQPYFTEQALNGTMKFVGGTSVMGEVNGNRRGGSKQKKLICTKTMKRC